MHGAEAELIRRHETIEDVFARDLIPERLRDGSPAAMAEGWAATGLDHVSVTCADLDRSLDFYSRPARDRGPRPRRGTRRERVRDHRDRRAPASAGPTSSSATARSLELIYYLDPAGTPIRPEPNDPGATHIWRCGSPTSTPPTRGCAKRALETRSEPITIEAPGAWQGARAFYATDPDGVTVELIQPATPARGQ